MKKRLHSAACAFVFALLAAVLILLDVRPVPAQVIALRDVDFAFAVYAEPDLNTEVLEIFQPQQLLILQEADNGWAQIHTYRGPVWAYLKEEVYALETELNQFMEPYGSGYSVFYQNLETGYTYYYNASKLYYVASVIKAPFALYLYQQADAGAVDLTKTYTYARADYRGYAGVVKRMPFGTELTHAQLLGYAVRHSDNIAFHVLLGQYGAADFTAHIEALGGRTNYLSKLTDTIFSAEDAAFYLQNIYDYMEAPGVNNEQLKADLLEASEGFIQSDYTLAHKYGLWEGAMHDMAIVYADSPYLLAILSNKGTPEATAPGSARADFKEISMKFQEINAGF